MLPTFPDNGLWQILRLGLKELETPSPSQVQRLKLHSRIASAIKKTAGGEKQFDFARVGMMSHMTQAVNGSTAGSASRRACSGLEPPQRSRKMP